MVPYVVGFLLWLLFAAYLVWRIRAGIKRRVSISVEINWAVYFTALTLMGLLGALLPPETMTGQAIFMVVGLVVSIVAAYILRRKYDRWLDGEKKAAGEGGDHL